MKIKFIGTGSGRTNLERYHSSILIQTENQNLLVDTGDGISRALLAGKVEFNLINSVLLSHYHPDHFGGIASLITQMYLSGRKEKLIIFTHSKLLDALTMYLNYSYLFVERLGFDIDFRGYEFENLTNVSDGIIFEARKNSHVSSEKFDQNNAGIHFLSSSFWFQVQSVRLVYTADIGAREDLDLFKNKSFDYFIVESTHVKWDDILKCFTQSGSGTLILTHLDVESKEFNPWLNSLPKSIRQNVLIAYDGLEIDR